MTTWTAPQIPGLRGDESVEEMREAYKKLANIVALGFKDMEFIINGNIASDNAREIGGWRIRPKEVISKDGDVGMSTEDTGADDIRFFAGGVDKETALFKVRKSGKTTIQSSNGYPRIELSADGDLISAHSSLGNYVAMVPSASGSPGYLIFDGGVIALQFQALSGTPTLLAESSKPLRIQAGTTLYLTGSTVRISTGDSGTFTTADGKTVTVDYGVITSIV